MCLRLLASTAMPLPEYFLRMPEFKVTLDAGSKATRAQEIDPRDISGPKGALDQSLGIQLARNCLPRSSWILQSEATMLVLCAEEKTCNYLLQAGQDEPIDTSKTPKCELIVSNTEYLELIPYCIYF